MEYVECLEVSFKIYLHIISIASLLSVDVLAYYPKDHWVIWRLTLLSLINYFRVLIFVCSFDWSRMVLIDHILWPALSDIQVFVFLSYKAYWHRHLPFISIDTDSLSPRFSSNQPFYPRSTFSVASQHLQTIMQIIWATPSQENN